MGARLQLAMSPVQIDALPVPGWKKTILRAMARYGMFVGDTGGTSWGLQTESSASFTSFGEPDPLVRLAQSNDWPPYGSVWVGNVRDGVDWARDRDSTPPRRRHACSLPSPGSGGPDE